MSATSAFTGGDRGLRHVVGSLSSLLLAPNEVVSLGLSWATAKSADAVTPFQSVLTGDVASTMTFPSIWNPTSTPAACAWVAAIRPGTQNSTSNKLVRSAIDLRVKLRVTRTISTPLPKRTGGAEVGFTSGSPRPPAVYRAEVTECVGRGSKPPRAPPLRVASLTVQEVSLPGQLRAARYPPL